MKLCQTEPLGPLDYHHRGVRHVDPNLHQRRADQQFDFTISKADHRLGLLLVAHAAVQQGDAVGELRKNLLAQPFELALGGSDLQSLGLVDHRVYGKRLPSSGKLPAHESVGLCTLVRRDEGRLDRNTPRRHFEYSSYVKITIKRQRQRPRYRSGGHDEHVRIEPLASQPPPLMDPEAMLLVDDDQVEIAEPRLIGNQRVGPDH